MKICVIGTGYVGLVTGVCFAELGHQISCVDIDKEKVKRLRSGESVIYEPGIEELLKRNIKNGRLKFFDNMKEGIYGAEIVFIAVGTPSKDDGTVETKYVEMAAKDIGLALDHYVVIVNKSTVPIGTGERVREAIAKYYRGEFDLVSNPEFLREGQAISDFMHPDRVVIGVAEDKARKIMGRLYRNIKTKILYTNIRTAEMIKYASNAYLATSISFINSLAELCEHVDSDVREVALGMKLDKRIGQHAFLSAGPGYGGSCFPKDVKGLISIARNNRIALPILEATEKVNGEQRQKVFQKVKKLVPRLRGAKIAVWGLAFKSMTDDLRESPSVDVIKLLLEAGAKITCYDPVAKDNCRKIFPEVNFMDSALGAFTGADCLLVMTEWPEFKNISFKQIKKSIGQSNIVDARNIYDKATAKKEGFRYEGIGQPR